MAGAGIIASKSSQLADRHEFEVAEAYLSCQVGNTQLLSGPIDGGSGINAS
jgi:hypothetical protein